MWSKQILSFKLPLLSFPSTSTKLLIQGVPHVLASKLLLSASYQFLVLKASFKCTWIGLQGISLSVTLGSSCIWYEDLGSIEYHQKHLGSFVKFAPCLSPTWGRKGCWLATVDSCFYLWVDTSFLELWTDTVFVLLGWLTELVINLALGG